MRAEASITALFNLPSSSSLEDMYVSSKLRPSRRSSARERSLLTYSGLIVAWGPGRYNPLGDKGCALRFRPK